ncbi:hypothetical protein FOQG_19464 [Fusarium oxysporum f. sp. raphani 54005]|uniref:Uncharacterized protein n=1 Tax=Fusarium oxysporum f. sp. raphani 54005 TaxID=1089458 RepID=X0B208_FUSOX|nr:hypothetical protein FOQG_19464 [Fusarium oxysporum f. sp. raphani 54005]
MLLHSLYQTETTRMNRLQAVTTRIPALTMTNCLHHPIVLFLSTATRAFLPLQHHLL